MKTKIKVKYKINLYKCIQENFKFFYDIMLCLYLFSHVALEWDSSYTGLRQFITVCFLVTGILFLITCWQREGQIYFEVNGFVIWYILFIFLTLCSVIYSVDRRGSISMVVSFFINFIIVYSIWFRIRYVTDVDRIICICIIAYALTDLYIMMNSSFDGVVRLGTEGGGTQGNIVNILASQSAISAVFNLYIIIKYNKRKSILAFGLAMEVFLIYATILCGSRGGIVVLFIGLFLLSYLYVPRKRKKYIIFLIVIMLIIFLYLVNNNETVNTLFYNGFSGLFSYLKGNRDQTVDISTTERFGFVGVAISFFWKSPIWGYGICSFGTISGTGVYAHNTYAELLTGMGIIGLLEYYSIPLLYLLIMIKTKKTSNLDIALVFAIMMIFLIYQQASITFLGTIHWIDLVIIDKIFFYHKLGPYRIIKFKI